MDVSEKLVELQTQAPIGWTKGEFADYLIANGVTVQEWISVKDRLPKNIGLYLVLEKHWINGSPCRRIAKWNTVDWFTADRKSKEITPRVTHWMPLPEPPKGGNNNGC